MDFQTEIEALLANNGITGMLEIPPDPKLGDYALPCFSLAKERKQAPAAIAKHLASILQTHFLERVEAVGPYVNFYIKPTARALAIARASQQEIWRSGDNTKRVLIEYPSPNTNKPLHLGHVRNMVLGSTLANMLRLDGNTVISVNLNNDRGVHICKSMLSYEKWGNNSEPDKKTDHFVGDWYVRFAKEVQLHPELEDAVQAMLVAWENNDPVVRALWKKMNTWALDGFAETYKRYQIQFDKVYNESDIYQEGKKIVLNAKDKFITDETGALIAPLASFGLPDKILLRKDGTSIYITQDIALTLQKMKEFNPDVQIWVVANEQNLHFKQLFAILELLGTPRDTFYHLSYGMVSLPEGRMKSREGRVVDADDILDELEAMARTVVEQSHAEWSEEKILATSRSVAIGALRFFMIKFDPERDFTFNPESSLSFEGDTGPYIQYTHARLCSILAKTTLGEADATLLTDEEEQAVLRILSLTAAAYRNAVRDYKPSIIATHLLELARTTNTFYHACPVLHAPEGKREARLLLINKVRETLATGLQILGMDSLSEL